MSFQFELTYLFGRALDPMWGPRLDFVQRYGMGIAMADGSISALQWTSAFPSGRIPGYGPTHLFVVNSPDSVETMTRWCETRVAAEELHDLGNAWLKIDFERSTEAALFDWFDRIMTLPIRNFESIRRPPNLKACSMSPFFQEQLYRFNRVYLLWAIKSHCPPTFVVDGGGWPWPTFDDRTLVRGVAACMLLPYNRLSQSDALGFMCRMALLVMSPEMEQLPRLTLLVENDDDLAQAVGARVGYEYMTLHYVVLSTIRGIVQSQARKCDMTMLGDAIPMPKHFLCAIEAMKALPFNE
jgi:hypothetical protein